MGIEGSASECILVSLLAARYDTLKGLKARFPFVEEGILLSKLVGYCSKEVRLVGKTSREVERRDIRPTRRWKRRP